MSTNVSTMPARVGQTFKHKQFGADVEVKHVESGRVRVQSARPGSEPITMHVEQLYEHYNAKD